MKKEFLECGKVCSAHGVHGVIKIEPWCDSPKVLASQKHVFLAEKDGSYKELAVRNASCAGEFVLMSIDGIDSRETVQAMKNTVLYLHRSDIPIAKGAVLIADMIDLPLIDIDTGVTYGTVVDINDGVQGKLYTVKTERGEVIFPGIPEFVKEIDTERGIFVKTIPGFFD